MPPKPVEVADTISIYDPALDKWFEGNWNIFYQQDTSKYAAINFSSVGDSTVIGGTPGKKILLYSIWLTIGSETNITFKDGSTNISGPMDFAGASEPRGIVVPLLALPIQLGEGNSFVINSSSAAQVSGTAVYRLD